ncbi:MAG TPA: hypothetical protein VFN75_10140 [Pseudonocardiaceae bacterium]|nr:hypothetical protein [Pseudonocardiaceae bacterium]
MAPANSATGSPISKTLSPPPQRSTRSPDSPGNPNVAETWYGTTPDRSDGLDLGRRRAVLSKLLTVTVLPTSKGRRPDGSYFDPAGIHIEWETH